MPNDDTTAASRKLETIGATSATETTNANRRWSESNRLGVSLMRRRSVAPRSASLQLVMNNSPIIAGGQSVPMLSVRWAGSAAARMAPQ